MILAVFGVGQKEDKDLLSVEVDGSNESVGIAFQIEDVNGSPALDRDRIRTGKDRPHLLEVPPAGVPGDIVPMFQGAFGRGMKLRIKVQSLLGNNPHCGLFGNI